MINEAPRKQNPVEARVRPIAVHLDDCLTQCTQMKSNTMESIPPRTREFFMLARIECIGGIVTLGETWANMGAGLHKLLLNGHRHGEDRVTGGMEHVL